MKTCLNLIMIYHFQRGAAVDKHKLKEIEERDAEIARLIHKQEQLKKAKRDKERQLRKEAKGKGVPVVSRFDYVKGLGSNWQSISKHRRTEI